MRVTKVFPVNLSIDRIDMYRWVTEMRSAEYVSFAPAQGYVYRWLPVTFSVPWEMAWRPVTSATCELTCTIGVDFPSPLLRVVARMNGSKFFLRRHLAVEGAAFARHIERKFAS